MPNWCDTTYCVHGDTSQLCRLAIVLAAATTLHRAKEPGHFDSDWLGNIYMASGYTETEIKDLEWIRCRGRINNVNIEYNTYKEEAQDINNIKAIYINCETAWDPMMDSFHRLLKEKYSGLELDVLAEEPGMEIYINTDTTGEYFTECWGTDVEDAGPERWEQKDEYELLKYIEEKTGCKFSFVEEAIANQDKLTAGRRKITKHVDSYFLIYDYTI